MQLTFTKPKSFVFYDSCLARESFERCKNRLWIGAGWRRLEQTSESDLIKLGTQETERMSGFGCGCLFS